MPSPIVVEIPVGLEELVPEYLNGRKEEAMTLAELLAAFELESIRRIAHDLKGNGASFGFPPLTELGAAMERAVKRSDFEDLGQQIRNLAEYLDRVQLTRSALSPDASPWREPGDNKLTAACPLGTRT